MKLEYFDKVENKISENDLAIGDHFMLDLYPVYGNGLGRDPTDVEIWEVVVTKKRIYDKKRKQWFYFQPIRKVTTGRQFGYPNGYWKIPKNAKQEM